MRRRRAADRDEGDEFDDIFDAMDRLMRGFRIGDWSRIPFGKPLYYGVSVDIGQDGLPHVREFGNARSLEQGLEPSDVREPFVTSFYDPDTGRVDVTAEMPGVAEEDIRVDVQRDLIHIRAKSADRAYETTVEVDTPVEAGSLERSYKHGVLHLTLNAKATQRPGARG